MTRVRGGPDPHEAERSDGPRDRRPRSLGREPSPPPGTSNRIPKHGRSRVCIELEVHSPNQRSLQNYGERGGPLPWLRHVECDERLGVSPRERLRNMRQKLRELRIVAIRQRVLDIAVLERTKSKPLRTE